MDKVSGRLTVFFEEPFWIGVFERISEGKLSVCKVTFGAEPKDYEVYDFVLRNYYRLKFSPAVATDVTLHTDNFPSDMRTNTPIQNGSSKNTVNLPDTLSGCGN